MQHSRLKIIHERIILDARDAIRCSPHVQIAATVGELVTGGQAKVKVSRTNNSWFGVTYRENRPRVVESVRKLTTRGDYPENLWA